jgi:transcriptional regulator with XRE-family HTH domain
MSFCSHFNEYLSLLEITYPQFARYSGLSVSAVRRYKNGESEPALDSEQFNKLTNAFFGLPVKKASS